MAIELVCQGSARAVCGRRRFDIGLEWWGLTDRPGYSMTSSPATHFQLSLWAGVVEPGPATLGALNRTGAGGAIVRLSAVQIQPV